MKNNNGKIAIAIVAMFVVALSVVGFTYAYFTATVNPNNNDESVTVKAGELVINYTRNKVLSAQNIVPGWSSNGKMYYDAQHSVYEVTLESGAKINAIKAVSTEDYATKSSTNQAPTAADGITQPAQFTIENTGTDRAYYSIDLNVITNEIVDKANLTYTLTGSVTTGDIVNQAVPANGVITIDPQEYVEAGKSNAYTLTLNYANNGDQSASAIGAKVEVEVDVNGLGQDGTVK